MNQNIIYVNAEGTGHILGKEALIQNYFNLDQKMEIDEAILT